MRTYLILLFFLTFKSFAQEITFPVDSTTNRVSYTNVVQINKSQNELYDNAMSWVSNYYKSSKSVIDMADKDLGKIVLKPVLRQIWNMTFSVNELGYWNYKVTILVKDNKYKYIVTDFYHKGAQAKSLGFLEDQPELSSLSNPNKKMYAYMIQNLSEEMEMLISSLEKTMLQKSEKDF